MCGICGFTGPHAANRLDAMTQAIAHRGPNSKGTRIFEASERRLISGLGHRRLSIIDISDDGIQPMTNEDESVWIAYNGEIYNYRELRKELIAQGHRFRSETDTEVIVHLYEQYGAECVRRLNGMFAFAIWDAKANAMFLARDHVGIKPLYYTFMNGNFLFGSEIKSILRGLDRSPDVNWQAVSDYFSFLYVPGPETSFENIRQLPPGHMMTVKLDSLEHRIECYWDASHYIPKAGEMDLSKNWIPEIRNILTDAVQRQMVSDVPLGVFLSGGIDSTVLAALAARSSSETVKTFTVAFQGKGVEFYNETDFAKIVSRTYRTEHHELLIDLNQIDKMLELVQYFDQPFGNPTFFLNYLISKYTKDYVTVALSGGGGDELFAGYPRYKGIELARKLKYVPPGLVNAAGKAASLFSDSFRNPTLRRAKLFLEGFDRDFAKQYGAWTYYYSGGIKEKLIPDLYRKTQPYERVLREHLEDESLDFDSRVEMLDLYTFLSSNILEYTDRTSMAVGFEIRVPFLDHRLVEMSLGIPFSRKLHKGTSKFILKEAFKDLIPHEIMHGEKRGFVPPLAFWMREILDGYFETQMTRESVKRNGIFSWDMIQALRNQHKAGKRDNSMELFGIIMFDVWFKKYVIG